MVKEKGTAYFQIGEVSERTGVTQRTLRFYEEKGLLKPPSRMEGGFRLYTAEDIQRVAQIKQLQKLLGFSLAEIKDMLEADETRILLRAEYRTEADISLKKEKLIRAIQVTQSQANLINQKIDEKIEQLNLMRSYWRKKLAHYEARLKELEKEEQARLDRSSAAV